MKKMIVIIFVFLLAFSFTSCSKNPSDVILNLKACMDKGNYEESKAYYTKETVKMIEDAEKKFPEMKDKKKGKEFAEGSEWEIISEDIQGDSAKVMIKIIEHPVENMKGHETTYLLKKEDGEWKIDIAATIQAAMQGLNTMRTMKGAGGLKNMKKLNKLLKK